MKTVAEKIRELKEREAQVKAMDGDKAAGIAAIFTPGTDTGDIIKYIREKIH